MESYAAGETDTPLLEETIGANLERTVPAHGDREALVEVATGEELCAWVTMRSGTEPLDARAVREFSAGRLPHYTIPRYVMVVEEVPLTVTGTIRKVQMPQESAARLGPA